LRTTRAPQVLDAFRVERDFPDDERAPDLDELADADDAALRPKASQEIDVETGGDGERHDSDPGRSPDQGGERPTW
jgi:hypothetical protein